MPPLRAPIFIPAGAKEEEDSKDGSDDAGEQREKKKTN